MDFISSSLRRLRETKSIAKGQARATAAVAAKAMSTKKWAVLFKRWVWGIKLLLDERLRPEQAADQVPTHDDKTSDVAERVRDGE